MQELIILSLTQQMRKRAEKLIYEATAHDKRLKCADAIAIAESLDVPPQEIGKLASMLQIKISKCRLNCF